MNINTDRITFFFALVLGFCSLAANVYAIGQVTEPIVVTDALRGQEISEKLTLTNSENVPVIFQLKGEGQIADWVSFYRPEDLNNKITEIQVSPVFYNNVTVVFRIPDDTPNGTYEGTIDVIVSPEKNKSEQAASVNMRVSRPVSITISGKEVLKLSAEITAANYWVKSGEPAQIRVIYSNEGNVIAKPDIQLKIFDNTNAVIFNAIFPYPDNIDAVKAGERKEIPLIEWQTTGQKEGDYLVEASVLIGGEMQQTEKITFTVTAGESKTPTGNVKINGLSPLVLTIIGILIGALTIFLILFFIKKRGNKITS